jgi:ABC-type polysaccharide/polyol phosphate transport system ATPase subunit
MSDIAIRCHQLSKQYRIGERESYKALRDVIADGVASPFRRLRSALARSGPSSNGSSNSSNSYSVPGTQPAAPSPNTQFWALDDVSFEVKRGEVVGIIGRNGAGKSTLLKILSRITKPTKGHAEIHGRVGSLLEVGTGFHPELTGRENIYLNAAILGMRRAEVEKKFDEMVAFAEVEKFIDTPVKRYSSGMYVRLAFAVAAHMETEVLLVDEVLAVGDAQFQKKCLGKMGDVAKQGRTVMFVSHSLQAIATLTKRTILIKGGHLEYDGDTNSALARYRASWNSDGNVDYVGPSKSNGVTKARVITSDTNRIHRFGKPLSFEFEIAFRNKPKSGAFSIQIVDDQAKPIIHTWIFDSDKQWSREGNLTVHCVIPAPRLYMGQYTLTTYLSDRASLDHFETLTGICPFEVVMDGIPREYEWMKGTCTYLEDSQWSVG